MVQQLVQNHDLPEKLHHLLHHWWCTGGANCLNRCFISVLIAPLTAPLVVHCIQYPLILVLLHHLLHHCTTWWCKRLFMFTPRLCAVMQTRKAGITHCPLRPALNVHTAPLRCHANPQSGNYPLPFASYKRLIGSLPSHIPD